MRSSNISKNSCLGKIRKFSAYSKFLKKGEIFLNCRRNDGDGRKRGWGVKLGNEKGGRDVLHGRTKILLGLGDFVLRDWGNIGKN